MGVKATAAGAMITDLRERFQALVSTDVDVLDGPQLSANIAPSTVIFGWSTDLTPAVTVQRDDNTRTPVAPRGLRSRPQETLTLAYLIVGTLGDSDDLAAIAGARARVVELHTELANMIDAMTPSDGPCDGGIVLGPMEMWFQSPDEDNGYEVAVQGQIVGWRFL